MSVPHLPVRTALLVALTLAAAAARAAKEDETIVVTATRLETPLREVGSAVTVVDAEEIATRGIANIADVLRDTPGVEVARAGGPGQFTSLFIRGADSDRIKILVDGVELNSPIAPGRAADVSSLSVEDIERIEIIRGPQSVLYGSDAIGGVINIITKRGGPERELSLKGEGGSYATFQESLSSGGPLGKLGRYYVNVTRWDSDGITSAAEKDGNHEEDGLENTSFSANFSAQPNDASDVFLLIRHLDANLDIDDFGGPGGDDPNHTLDTEQTIVRAESKLRAFDDFWEQAVAFSYLETDQQDNDDADAVDPSTIRSDFNGERYGWDWQNNLRLRDDQTLTLGVDYNEERGDSVYESMFGVDEFPERTADTWGGYAQYKLGWQNRFFTTAGARYDDHEEFGSAVTYRIAPAYWIESSGTKLKGAVGTGFKAPSLFQLYSSFGTPDLKEEESTGWEAGLEQTLVEDRLTVEAVYFDQTFDDMISFDSAASRYENINDADVDGVEFILHVRATDDLEFQGHYTYLETEDGSTNDDLVRRPDHKFGVDAAWRPLARLLLRGGVLYVGEREDLDFSTFPAQRVTLDAYQLWHARVAYDMTDRVQLFARVENILDEDYEEVSGFETPGASGYAGAKLTL